MPIPLNPLVAAVAEPPIAEAHAWIAGRSFPADRPLLDLAQAVPSYPPAESLRDHLAEIVRRPETSLYTDILGLPALRAALAAHISEAYAADIAAAHVGITAGCNQAFCVAVNALAGAGDEVILPAPYYFNHRMWLDMQGLRAVYLPCEEGRGAIPDPAAAARLIGDRTRAIVLVTPNNPTGAIYPPETMAAFFDLARARGIALIVDETYKDFRPNTGPAHGLFANTGWQDTLVQLYSFSKAYSLTGYRVGAIVCGPAILGAVEKIMDCVAICAPNLSQQAALFGLANLAGWREEKRQLMNARVAALREAFAGTNSGYAPVSAGAYFAWVRHPHEGSDSMQVARTLAKDHNLLCLPGSMFGPGQDRYLRLAFANLDAASMTEVVGRLDANAGGTA
ncbi:MAG: aminotransferase [Alphaproteobacteria bacterium]|nr:aminotransferase [Alphaproteobacteria bacterium]